MAKKRFNWKARQVVNTVIDDTETKKISVELEPKGSYDQSNELVLPSKKRRTKKKTTHEKVTRILSKKQRKRLEKIVERKEKKQNRAQLLESLQECKVSQEELSMLTSLPSIQTKGLKRYFQEELNMLKKRKKEDLDILCGKTKLNGLSGAKRRKLLEYTEKQDIKNNDPNVVAFDSSGSDVDSSDAEDDKEIVNKECDEKTETISEVDTSVANVMEQKEEMIIPNDNIIIEIKDDAQTFKNVKDQLPRKPAVYVDVVRSDEIQKARLKLPILAEEQSIMEIINENPIVVIAGETGSGKTTQVPQFLYEAGYALKKQIAVTEPRRVAAVSMSQRVAEEMNLSTTEVSYLIRFEGNVTENTKIKFMTDGVLLKEVQNDFLLNKYSVVILDEAHERSVYTDILIGLLSRIVPLRQKRRDPLKLIIMSATLRLADFISNERLFKTPPKVIVVESRQFPVTIHFNKRTNENYLRDALNKTVKIHTKLPDGGILVFVTGQQEVNMLVKKLRQTFPLRHKDKILQKDADQKEKDSGYERSSENDDEDDEDSRKVLHRRKKTKVLPKINLDDYSIPGDIEVNSDDDLEDDENDDFEDVTAMIGANVQPLWTLPLYSMLPIHKQKKVFQQPPSGCRLCVVSTNVAETSITIPDIKYIVDTGKSKMKLYDKVTGVTGHVVHWCSKASANQRAGRAGRTAPGHCYRLYSSAVFNDVFQDYPVPEIQQKPVDDLYLQMKCMNIDKIVNFPFPSAPDLLQLKTAEKRLEVLGALKDGQVTPLGKAISKFPVLPRYGKMLALSHQQDLLPYTICLVAALSVQEVLLEVPLTQVTPMNLKEIRQRWAATRLRWSGQGNSFLLGDNMVLLRAVGAAEYANSEGKLEKFCDENGLRHKAVVEIRKLRMQLTDAIKSNVPDVDVCVDPKLVPPTDIQAKLLRQIMLAGMGDQIAKKIQPDELKEGEEKAKFKYAYRANNMEEPVFLHQSSVLKSKLPEFVVYQEIYETNKMYMRGVTAVEPEWLAMYVPSLCNLSEPMLSPEPRYNPDTGKVYCTVSGTFGSQAWPLPNIEIVYPKSPDAYKWFARYLLQGDIFPALGKYTKSLLSQPSVIVKSWAKLQPRTECMLKALMRQDCCTKQCLENLWKTSPKYLLAEYLKWLPESAHSEICLLWPPVR